MDKNSAFHIIFLVFIVLLIIYVINKSFVTEKFSNNIVSEDIINIFKELKLDTPSEKSVSFYLDYMDQNNVSLEELKTVIKNNNSVSSEKSNEPILDSNIIKVNMVYNDVLFRNPNNQEVSFYSNLLATDNTFSIEKLRTLLLESAEYKRLLLTQDNAVYNDIQGNATDRQIEFKINTIYKDVTSEEVSDKETLNFLKKKYIQFNLDDDKLKQFITMYLQNKPYVQDEYMPKNNLINIKPEEVDAIKNELLNELKKSLAQDRVNKNITDQLENKAQNDNYIDSSNVLDTIHNESKKVFNKDATDYCYTNYGPKQDLANEINKRNMDELKNTCVRNLKSQGQDQDMVLDPKFAWSVPQTHGPVCTGNNNNYQPLIDQSSLIGTLLTDAKDNTRIIPTRDPVITHAT
jgi:hypothetical protein